MNTKRDGALAFLTPPSPPPPPPPPLTSAGAERAARPQLLRWHASELAIALRSIPGEYPPPLYY